jgi:hypothetical protein
MLALVAVLAWNPASALAANRSTGAVLKENCDAPAGMKPGKTVIRLKAGTFVAFMKMQALTPKWGEYKSEGGKIRGVVIQDNDRGFTEAVWVPEEKLEFFSFDTDEPNNSPHQIQGGKPQWSLAFKTAARAKCKELGIQPASPAFIKK